MRFLQYKETQREGGPKHNVAINPFRVAAVFEDSGHAMIYMIGAEASYISVDATFDKVIADLKSVVEPISGAIREQREPLW